MQFGIVTDRKLSGTITASCVYCGLFKELNLILKEWVPLCLKHEGTLSKQNAMISRRIKEFWKQKVAVGYLYTVSRCICCDWCDKRLNSQNPRRKYREDFQGKKEEDNLGAQETGE